MEAVYADDAMHGCLHESPVFMDAAIQFAAEQMQIVTRRYGLALNYGRGKTEAILALRGPGVKDCKAQIQAAGGLPSGEFTLRVVPAYKHLGTLVTFTAVPTRNAARRTQQASKADAKMSGHLLGSLQLPLETKILAATTLVDTVLLHASELWPPLAAGIAQKVKYVHTRWLRKATAEFRTSLEPNLTDEEVRSIYMLHSTNSLIACRRLRYLSSFGKACPFVRALLQGCEGNHPWVVQIRDDLVKLPAANPKLVSMPHPRLDVDSRVVLAITHPAAWRKYLKAWAHPHAMQREEIAKIICPACGKLFLFAARAGISSS